MEPDGGAAVAPARRPPDWTRNGLLLALPGAVLVAIFASWGLDRDAWFDEALSVAATEQLAETYDRTAYTMATYYAQLTAWTAPSTELWWVRLLSVIHSVGAVFVLGAIAVRAYGRRVALWSTIFLGSSWIMVRYAHEARSFAFLVLVVTLGWLATDHLVEDPTRRGWIAVHLAVGVLAPLTHGMAVFALGMQAVALLSSRVSRRTWFVTVPGWSVAVLVTLILYRMGGSELGTPAQPASGRFYYRFLAQFHGSPPIQVPDEVWIAVLAMSVYGAGLAVVRLRRAKPGLESFRAVAPVAWGVGTVAAILVLNQFRPGVHVRYAVAAAPGLALTWALAAEHIGRWFESRGRPLALVGRTSAVAVGVVAVLLLGQLRYHETFSTGWTDLTEHIAHDALPGDGVVVPGPSRVAFDVAWSRLDDPPPVGSLWNVQPLGTVRRFDTFVGARDAHWQVTLSERLWVLERDVGSGDRGYDGFVERYAEVHGFSEVDSWQYDEITLHLFDKADRANG